MKHIALIILGWLFVSCSVSRQLNRQIDLNQKSSLTNSPFETANGMVSELNAQKKSRIQYVKELNELLKLHFNDTIILVENYDFICFGCPADYVQISVNNKMISYRKQIPGKKYKKAIEVLDSILCDSEDYCYPDIVELKSEIKDKNWNINPKKFGTDHCFDGGHTFYTVIYPDHQIISMYMRCWIPFEIRKQK
jgi:hypothetical protein